MGGINLIFRSMIVLMFVCAFPVGAASNIKPVADYVLDCGETFSCPSSLRPRVNFWVEVFTRWDTKTAVLHDKHNPHRVYSTISRKNGCRNSKNGDVLDRERSRIKRVLTAVARKVRAQQSLSAQESRIKALFGSASSREIENAASTIRCQSGNKDRMREALIQFGRYRPTILDALESQNLTPELQYLPFVESAFNPEAVSHVGAAGLWQIMPATGRVLGLTVTRNVDDRFDPDRASYAAAKYFRNSVNKLTETAISKGARVTAKNLNPFVITSYNYGVRGMERAIEQVGLDYERLLREYKSPNFQIAVKNFYASFLAARHVAKNSEKFYGDLKSEQLRSSFSSSTYQLSRATSVKRLSENLSVSRDRLKKLNPGLRKSIWNNKALVPSRYELRLPHREGGWRSQFVAINNLPKEYEEPGYFWHRVKRGQTACGLANRYGVSCNKIKSLNRLNRKGSIYVGRRIKIPSANGGIRAQASSNSSGSSVSYRVRSGDTPCGIAKRHKMSCSSLLSRNGLSSRSIIRVGQTLNLSGSKVHTTKSSQRTVAYRVRSGDTPCGIAKRRKMSCSNLLSINGLSSRSIIRVGQSLKVSAGSGSQVTARKSGNGVGGEAITSYSVRSGDTPCGIAERHQMKCSELLALNGLSTRTVIRVGQKLKITADDAWHVVVRGQTPCGIAERYSVSCSRLLTANRLSKRSVIRIGQRLRIPFRS